MDSAKRMEGLNFMTAQSLRPANSNWQDASMFVSCNGVLHTQKTSNLYIILQENFDRAENYAMKSAISFFGRADDFVSLARRQTLPLV